MNLPLALKLGTMALACGVYHVFNKPLAKQLEVVISQFILSHTKK